MGWFTRKDKKEKKEKPRCNLCGKEMSFFSTQSLADGTICADCEKLLRGDFLCVSYKQRNGMLTQTDPMKELTLDEARNLIAKKQEEAAAIIAQLGGSYENIFQTAESFIIAPNALDVGLKRAKILKDRGVFRGLVIAGSFHQGDTVQLKQGESLTPTTILELIPITTTSEFNTELAATHKKTVDAGSGAWLILDVPGIDILDDAIIIM